MDQNASDQMLSQNIMKALAERKLPALFPADEPVSSEVLQRVRQEWKTQIQEKEYGFLPTDEMKLSSEILETETVFDGKGTYYYAVLSLTGERGIFRLPVSVCIPKDRKEKCPGFVHIAYSVPKPDSFAPMKELCERGYALFAFDCGDATKDEDEYESGLYSYFQDRNAIKNRKVGKLAVWAYAAMRVLDYALTFDEIDKNRMAVVGHSRLGKAAVFAGAMEERFGYVISNDSGCSGAALHRGKNGEQIKNITEKFERWFTADFCAYSEKEEELPFDQHTVMALVAPRYLYVCSATDDGWADPVSEFLGAAAVSEAYAACGKVGLVADDFPVGGQYFHKGCIGYHLREGGHSLAMEDWDRFMSFMDIHR